MVSCIMSDTVYSTYEAKSRFSEVMRIVREGRSVVVTYHGEPVAEIRPIDPRGGTAARLEWLRSRGSLLAEGSDPRAFASLASRPGALRRFLDDRHG
ncbi:type II toxin-antitoxin system Phd/YefM family antitoxin [Gaopeijia maritima]|uniref:type II toxin-antitoxin system Phd/YefM family antitoxin n=1 Tax=Gaopeijia maritima TaxID=3119007 RepID=UPI0038706C84